MNQSLLLTYHVRCSACWHTLLLHRGGVSACCSCFPLCARSRLPWSFIPRYIPSSSTKCSQSPQQPYATTMWRISFYAAPPTPQHVFLMLLPRLATSSPAPSPKGNASTTAVHWMARMARAEALREGSAVPLFLCHK